MCQKHQDGDCPIPHSSTPPPFILAQDVITEDYTCASISVAMNVGALADTLCQGNLDPLLSNQPLTIYCQVYIYIQVIQDPYVSASTVTSQARIELLSYNAGCDSPGSCTMQGGASLGGTTPSEDPWFCVRPAPSKCADLDDGSYVVAIQARLPTPEPPPPPPTP